MNAAVLDDRGVIEIGGSEAGPFLQRLVTNDVLGLQPSEARYAALLTPQGKILVDFLIVAGSGDSAGLYVVDCPRSLVSVLAGKLTLYRLRAKVTIVDRSTEMGVAAVWPDRPGVDGLVYRDPRRDSLGYRVAAPWAQLVRWFERSEPELYRSRRILSDVPQGGVDFPYGDTFPHEANLDRLHGLDFSKGCYVGQEVVSRVEHRGTARKRVTGVAFEGAPPAAGAEVMMGDVVIGTMGSTIPGHGLALIRTDKASEAEALGVAVTSAGTPLSLTPGA